MTTEIPAPDPIFRSNDQETTVLYKADRLFDPLFNLNKQEIEEPNEKRSVSIPEGFKIYEAVPSNHQQ